MPKSTGTEKGQTVTKTLLNKRYGAHVRTVLADHLLQLSRKKGEIAKYRVLQALPTPEEFIRLRIKHFTTTVGDLVSDAFSEIEELAGELQEWYDNLPESFQQGEKGQQVEEAKDTLENINQPEIDEMAGKLQVVYIPAEDVDSRAKRAGDAAGRLAAAAEAIRDESEREDLEEELEEGSEQPPKLVHDDGTCNAPSELADELESAQQELEGIEFPGMY